MSLKQQVIKSFLVGFGTTSGALTAAGFVGIISNYFYKNYIKESDRKPSDADNDDPSVNLNSIVNSGPNTDIGQMSPLPYEGNTYSQYSLPPQIDTKLEAVNSHHYHV